MLTRENETANTAPFLDLTGRRYVENGALEQIGGSSTRRSESDPAATHVCFEGQLINKAALRAQPSGASSLQPLIGIVAATDQQVSTTPITTGLLITQLRV